MSARSEPLLWLQLIGLGALPLEALLVLLLLSGSDPGPLPGLERLLCWAIGALAPAVLLWQRPADVWSLLLVQTPLRGRRDLQQRLSRLQQSLPLRIGLVLGAGLALPLLWWLDREAAVASSFAPLAGGSRLLALFLTSLVVPVMLWQWQQILQSLWLLSRPTQAIEAAAPLSQGEIEASRLSLGLPLLLPDPLLWPSPAPRAAPAPPAVPAPPAPSEPSTQVGKAEQPGEGEEPDQTEVEESGDLPVAVEPEQPPEEPEGTDLDQQVG